ILLAPSEDEGIWREVVNIPFFMIWCGAPHRGNLFRALLIGLIIMGLILFISTDLAPLFRETGEMAGLSFPEGYGEVSSLDAGSQVVPWLLVRVISPFYGLDMSIGEIEIR
ncbi:PTS system, galactitol-specific IIC component, partial [Candidatus Hakubella thermalkaliphila]